MNNNNNNLFINNDDVIIIFLENVTLGLAAAVLTLLPRLESVLVAIATAVDELLAHAVAALVVPLQQRLPARPTLLRQEAKF